MLGALKLAAEVAKRAGLDEEKARKIVTAVFSTIADTLAMGEDVTLTYLGRFRVHQYPSRTIPDPQGGDHHLVLLPQKVVKFKPALELRFRVERRKGRLHLPDDEAEPPDTVELLTPVKPTLEDPIEVKTPALDKEKKDSPAPNWLALFSRHKKEQLAKRGRLAVSSRDAGPTGSSRSDAPLTVAPANTPAAAPAAKPPAPPAPPSPPSPPPIPVPVHRTVAASVTAKEAEEENAPQAPKLSTARVRIDFPNLSELKVDKKILNLLPELFARRHQSVPIAATKSEVTVAMVDPENLETIQLIKKNVGRNVKPVLASSEDVSRILNQFSGLEAEVASAVKDTSALGISRRELTEAKHENVETAGDDSPTARIISSLLRRAVREKASDVHIEPYEKAVVVRFRIDGVLRIRVKLPKEILPAVISRLKILSNLKIDEHRLPQDGRFRLIVDNHAVDFRLSTLPVADGEKAVMRILDKSQGILSLEEIGVREHGYDILKANVQKSYGMTLVTGPTGSGKTTTLYALLGQLMDVGVNIVTLENPIEYRIEGINQSQVNPDIDYSFATGLRAIVRQDPDIIMVGEIRDKETADIAIQSALTGHIVLSTLHTNNAAGAIPRLIDMGMEPFLISSAVNTVVAQRLARKLCEHCQTEANPTAKELELVRAELLKLPKDMQRDPKKIAFHTAKGCDACNHSGYTGRIGLFEVLDVKGGIEQLILSSATDTKIQETAVSQGMITMLQDGILKAIDGITNLDEVWRVTRD